MESGVDIAAGADGAAYVGGHFEGETEIGGPLKSRGSRDIFIARLDRTGAWRWSVGAGSAGRDSLVALAATSSGELRVLARFAGDASVGEEKIDMPDSTGFAVIALDAAGHYRWAATGAGASGLHVATGASSSTFVAGTFTATLELGDLSLSADQNTAFLAEADTDGSWIWAKTLPHDVRDVAGHEDGRITVVSEDTVYHYTPAGELEWAVESPAGRLRQVAFSPDGAVVVGGSGVPSKEDEWEPVNNEPLLVAKIDKTGSVIWISSALHGRPARVEDLDVDTRGQIYIMGQFWEGIWFGAVEKLEGKRYDDTPPGTIGPVFKYVATRYVASISSEGDWLWADSELEALPLETSVTGDTTFAYTHAITADTAGVYLTGQFQDTLRLDGKIYQPRGERDVFVASLKNFELATPAILFGYHYPAYQSLPDTAMVLAWTLTPNVSMYQVRVWEDETVLSEDTIVLDTLVQESLAYLPIAVRDGRHTLYDARVRALGTDGELSRWTESGYGHARVRPFYFDLEVPDYGATIPPDTTISWTHVPGTTSGSVRVYNAGDPDRSFIIDATLGANDSTFDLSGLNETTTYNLTIGLNVEGYLGTQVFIAQFTTGTRSTDTADRTSPDRVPTAFRLEQNHPNPFNPTTSVRYVVARESPVKIILIDVLGRRVNTLVDSHHLPGTYMLKIDMGHLPSGIYFYHMESHGFSETRAMILAK